jgi:hypothetical protein
LKMKYSQMEILSLPHGSGRGGAIRRWEALEIS